MFQIWIKDFNQNGKFISEETLVEEVPAESQNDLKFISPIVKAEMGNVETFDFSIQAGSKFFDAFLQMKTYIRVVYDRTTIFYGRVLTIDNTPFKGTRKVRCEGPMSFLMDSPVEGKEEETRPRITTYEYLKKLINDHNTWVENEAGPMGISVSNKRFQLGQVPGHYTDANIIADQQIKDDSRKFGSDSWTDTKGALEDLRSHYGGYFRIRAGKIGSKLTLDWMDHYFNNTIIDQVVEVGKNIIDINDVAEVDNIFTAIIPIGRSNVTKNDSSDTNGGQTSKQNNLYIDGKILKVPDIVTDKDLNFSDADLNRGYHRKSDYANAIKNYGMIIKTVSLPDCTTKAKLKKEAGRWILNNYQGKVTKFTVKAVDMHQIGKKVTKISVGDRVQLSYPLNDEKGTTGERRTTTQTCLSIQYDLYHPENNSYTFGIPANILTKTYGLTKQKNSVTSSPDKKPNDITYPSNDKPKWRNLVAGWLMDHLRYYKGPRPFKPEYDEDGTAEKHMKDYQLYRPNNWLIKAHYDSPDEDSWNVEKDYTTKTVTEETIAKNRVVEYVKAEYGIDLRTYWPGITPETLAVYIDPETGEASPELLTGVWNGVTNLIDWFKITIGKPITDAAGNFWNSILGFFGFGGDPDNPTFNPLAFFDPTGNLNFWYYDSAGKLQFKNTRDLSIESVDTENFKGQMVKDGYVDKNGNVQPHKFGLGIEDYLGGKLVVARVEGDVVQIGDEGTLWHTTVAQKISGNFLNPIEFIVGTDPKTGEAQTIRVGTAGQASYKARWDDRKGCYVYDPNGNTILTGDGFWDEKNLAIKGGIYTVMEGGKYVSYIKSDRLVIGDQNTSTTILSALQTAGLINGNFDPQALVANSVYTNNLATLNAAIGDLTANKIDATNINAKLESVTTLTVKHTLAVNNLKGIAATGSSTSSATFDNFYGGNFIARYATGPDSYGEYNIGSSSIAHVAITGPVNNVYTLKMYNGFNTEIPPREGDTVTFSRAVTSFDFGVSGDGDGGYYNTYAVTPKPQNSPTLSFYLQAPLDYTPTVVSNNDKAVVSHIEVWKQNTGAQPTKIGTAKININSTSSWDKGNADGKTTGWDLARTKLSNAQPPASDSDLTSSFHVDIPASDYGGESAYYFSIDIDKNYVYAKNSLNQTVARIASNYNTGWTNAYGQASIPTDRQITKNEMTVKWPSNTPDGTANSRKFYMENYSNNIMDIVYVPSGGSKVVVARYTHNKYKDGRDSVDLGAGSGGEKKTYYASDSGLDGFSSFEVTANVPKGSVTFDYSSKHLGNGVYEHTYTTVNTNSSSPTNNKTTLYYY